MRESLVHDLQYTIHKVFTGFSWPDDNCISGFIRQQQIYSDLHSCTLSPRVLSRYAAKSSAREIHRSVRCGVNDSPLADPISAATLHSYISPWNSQFVISRNQTRLMRLYNVKYANFTNHFCGMTMRLIGRFYFRKVIINRINY